MRFSSNSRLNRLIVIIIVLLITSDYQIVNYLLKDLIFFFYNSYRIMSIKIRENVKGVTGDQINAELVIYVDNKKAGFLSYSEYQKSVSIQMIKIYPDFQRQGLGSKLVLDLQKRYPKTELEWGMMTPDGVELYRKLKSKLYVDRSKNKKITEYKKVKRELEDIKKQYSTIYKSEIGSKEKKILDQLNDREFKLEEKLFILEDDPAIRKFIFNGEKLIVRVVKSNLKYS